MTQDVHLFPEKSTFIDLLASINQFFEKSSCWCP